MNETETSRVEFDTNLNAELRSNYVQELINDSDLMVTNEELNLFPEIETNSYDNDEMNIPKISVLITEVDLETSLDSYDNQSSSEIHHMLTEEIHEPIEINEHQDQSVSVNDEIPNDEEEDKNDNLIEDDSEFHDEDKSLLIQDDFWDTDLEEDFDISRDRSTTSEYMDLCKKYDVVPVKFYLHNMHKPILSIKHHGLGPLGTKALAKSLESNITVDTLDLSGNWIYSAGALAIGKMLEENSFITKLVLSDNMIGDQGIVGICRALQINRGLRHLDLSGNHITDHGCVDLSEMITKSRYLTELSLSRNNIDSKGAHTLASSIASNDILEYLDLSWNKIRGNGAIDIAKGLKENIRIKSCNLSYNGFARDGGRALAEAIKDNNVLTFLNIEANRLDGETATLIGKALTANETLEELRMGHNAMDTGGILSLLSSVNSYDGSTLKILHITDVPIDYEITKVIEHIQSKRSEFQCVHGLEIGVGNSQDDIKKRLVNVKDPIILLKDHVLIKDRRLIDILIKLDVDKNNFVTTDQFARALQELGVPIRKVQLNDIQTRLDKMGNGTIYYGDFVQSKSNQSEDSSEIKEEV